VDGGVVDDVVMAWGGIEADAVVGLDAESFAGIGVAVDGDLDVFEAREMVD